MDYSDWMDGPGGYREWYDENYPDDAAKGAHTDTGSDGPPPKPPKPPVPVGG